MGKFIKILQPSKVVKSWQSKLYYRRWKFFIESSEYWPKSKLERYQLEKLQKLLFHCHDNVPYYKQLFREIDFNPNDLTKLSQLGELPILTKDTVRERIEEFFPTNRRKKDAIYFTTGGSTGKPLGFYRDRINEIIEKSFMMSQWSRVGYSEKSSRVILRGEPVKGDQIFEMRDKNTWVFSSYHLSGRNLRLYVETLNHLKPDYFHVYPSSFYLFTQLLIEHGLRLDFSPKAILCGSENLYPYQRDLFRKIFNSKVYSWLGLAEQTILAGECEASNALHAWPQHSIVELIGTSGNSVQINETYEIIGTNLHNYVTPFIRYRSGDRAVYGGLACHKCGREFLLLSSVEGRIQDYIYLKNGDKYPIGPAIFGIHDSFWAKIRQIQIIQVEYGKITIRISTNDEGVIEQIKTLLDQRFNELIEYDILLTNEFVRTNSGKHKFLIQDLQSKIIG